MASTRKVVLFIVEGPSDEAALGGIFTKIFNNAAVKFDVIHGDVTTSCQDPAKIREHVRNEILRHLSRDRGYGWKDLERIVVYAIRTARSCLLAASKRLAMDAFIMKRLAF